MDAQLVTRPASPGTSDRDAVQAVCVAHFGRYVASAGKWSPPNRCDSCPLRAPCLARGHAPARTFDELAESRATFYRAAAEILAVRS